MKDKILIYGASGYMGKLFVEYASQHQLNIVLAARSSFKTDKPFRLFSLDNKAVIINNLKDIQLVVNLAGAFYTTNKQLVEACIASKTHYIDIAGEVSEMETVFQYQHEAIKAGIMLMTGAGFGVVPTDIVANLAKNKLPDATHLKIAYITEGGASRGTLKTVLKDINKEGVILKNGKFLKAMPASATFSLELQGKKQNLVYNPWRADLFTAQISTGIQNIETYSNFPSFIVSMMQGKMLWLRDFILKRLINFLPEGPSPKQLQAGKTVCYAQVKNEKGETATATMLGPEAYLFTALTLVEISKKIVKGDYQVGFQTPNLYGIVLFKDLKQIKIS
jgi:short subunit dehydrogenase-like uncharacterized protein